MALRDQPYIPLYVQDFSTDEKLAECSASSTGVYIRIMCLMHKTEEYGVILLRQKDKQNESIIKNFASKLVKHLPYTEQVIFEAVFELVSECVLHIDGDKLIQKRMISDNSLSLLRQTSAKSKKFAGTKSEAKGEANIEYEIKNEYEGKITNKITVVKFNFVETLISYGGNEKLISDWLIVRKNKKASNTETALKSFIKEVEKSNKHIDEVLQVCVEKSWSGFKSEWLDNQNNGTTGQKQNSDRSSRVDSVTNLKKLSEAILDDYASKNGSTGV